jgi:hypothetical protein
MTTELLDTIPVLDDLVVEVTKCHLRIRRAEAVVVVHSKEVRHLIGALVQAAARLVDNQ